MLVLFSSMTVILKMMLHSHHRMPLLHGIKRVIFEKGQNFILLIIGKPQTGKSIVTMSLCYEWAYAMGLDKTFSLKSRVSMGDAKDFIEKTNLDLKRGMILVMEEGGKGMDGQLWYDKVQKDLKHIMHTFGHEGLFIIINAITKDINSKIMPLVRGELEMIDLNKSKGVSFGIFRIPIYDQTKRKVVRQKLPRMRYPDGTVRNVKHWVFKKPKNTSLIEDYMKWSVPAKVKIKEEKLRDMVKRDEKLKNRENKLNAKDIVELIKLSPETYKKIYNRRVFWDKGKIMGVHDVGGQITKKVVALLGDA